MEDKNQFVEQLLDSALAQLRKTGPRPGIEARILEGVRAAERQRAKGGGFWKPRTAGWVSVTATAVVVAALVLMTHRPATETQQPNRTVSIQPQHKELAAIPKATPKSNRAVPVLEAKQAVHKVRSTRRRTEAHHWPSQFPTPAPLTREEKALVRYVQQTPPQVLATPVLKKEATIQPVEIEPLRIPPLEIKPLPSAAASMHTQ